MPLEAPARHSQETHFYLWRLPSSPQLHQINREDLIDEKVDEGVPLGE